MMPSEEDWKPQNFWCITCDWCGLFCANLTLFLLFYAEFVILFIIHLPWYGWSWHSLFYTIVTLLAFISHSRCHYSNPGAIPKSWKPQTQDIRFEICRRCQTIKTKKTHHCSTCGRCIIKMDHHCPWVNNCVAIFNQKYFLLFLMWTFIACVYTAMLLIARFVSCTHMPRALTSGSQCCLSGADVIFSILNFIEAILFGLFVLVILCDQLGAIFDNTPGIDALQGKVGKKQSKMVNLRGVMGSSLGLHWFLPTALPTNVQSDDTVFQQSPALNSLHGIPPATNNI